MRKQCVKNDGKHGSCLVCKFTLEILSLQIAGLQKFLYGECLEKNTVVYLLLCGMCVSENNNITGSVGTCMKESKNINASLFQLHRVIDALKAKVCNLSHDLIT